jgi:tight adherence protein B
MRSVPSRFDSLASLVERLAVLLEAGVAPASAWGYLGSPRFADGRVLLDRDDGLEWRGLAAAWLVATEAGAPLAPTLHRFAASLRDLGDGERDARTALAGPRATARMVMVLPVVGVLFGLALGFDTVGTLFTTPPGIACLVAGALLILVARWWNGRLLRSARPSSAVPGLGLDLVAIAVSGGASISRALAAVGDAREVCGLPAGDASVVDDILVLSARAGVPAATLLRSSAEQARREARSEGRRKAESLGVTLMLPLGLCILPAFMLLGVAPLMISVVSSTVGSL